MFYLINISNRYSQHTFLLVDRINNRQLRFVVTHLGGGKDTEFVEGRPNLLFEVRPDLADVSAALVLHGLQVADGQRVVVDAATGVQRGDDDARLGHGVGGLQVVHRLANVPAVDVGPIEEGFVARVHFGGALDFAVRKSYLGQRCQVQPIYSLYASLLQIISYINSVFVNKAFVNKAYINIINNRL